MVYGTHIINWLFQDDDKKEGTKSKMDEPSAVNPVKSKLQEAAPDDGAYQV